MQTALEHWHALLSETDSEALCSRLADEMRARKLAFGGRQICSSLRPFFLDARDESRVRKAAETLWTLGERLARVAMDSPALVDDLALSEAEIRLAAIDPGYATTSTAARADAFILPDSLQFAEYNGESPAGAAYSLGLAQLFAAEPIMSRFHKRFGTRYYEPIELLLNALLASYREWGGRASPPTMAIVDWKEVPTYSEFEILRDSFVARGVPTIIADPRDLEYSGRGLFAHGQRIDFVYRRVLINDIIARAEECKALVDAYAQRAVCVANTLRCKIPHKKAFFAVLTDQRHAAMFSADERLLIERHVPWTAIVADRRIARAGQSVDLLPFLRANRETLVIKPNDEYGGSGVMLGWESSESDWDAAIERALRERDTAWVAQERIAVRREPFPMCDAPGVTMRDMLVDFAPFVFRGRLAGFLTRLSATGLANVTAGGGQVPAFVVSTKSQV